MSSRHTSTERLPLPARLSRISYDPANSYLMLLIRVRRTRNARYSLLPQCAQNALPRSTTAAPHPGQKLAVDSSGSPCEGCSSSRRSSLVAIAGCVAGAGGAVTPGYGMPPTLTTFVMVVFWRLKNVVIIIMEPTTIIGTPITAPMTVKVNRNPSSVRIKARIRMATMQFPLRNIRCCYWRPFIRGGPTNLDRSRGRDKCNSAGYAAAARG